MLQHDTRTILPLIVMALLVTACAGAVVSADSPNGESLPPVAAVRAREYLSDKLDMDVYSVMIVDHERVTWTTSCLELGGPAESCMRLDTPGWRVTLEADGETYSAHTDKLGEQVRIAP